MDVQAMLWAGFWSGAAWAAVVFAGAVSAYDVNKQTSGALVLLSGGFGIVATVCAILAAGWPS